MIKCFWGVDNWEIEEWMLHLDMEMTKIIKMKDNILILKIKKTYNKIFWERKITLK